jgi:hypothetical protein
MSKLQLDDDKIHQHKDIIIAYLNGKKIEMYSTIDNNKPEPTLIPYSFKDAHELAGMCVKSIKFGTLYIITVVEHECVGLGSIQVTYQELLDNYTECTGTPLGKIEN